MIFVHGSRKCLDMKKEQIPVSGAEYLKVDSNIFRIIKQDPSAKQSIRGGKRQKKNARVLVKQGPRCHIHRNRPSYNTRYSVRYRYRSAKKYDLLAKTTPSPTSKPDERNDTQSPAMQCTLYNSEGIHSSNTKPS